MFLLLFRATTTLTNSFHFTNVSFHFNKVFDRPNVQQKGYQSAVVLFSIFNVTFEQIEISNHNTTGLIGDNSVITFKRQNMFANNSGIYGEGIALYDFSQILVNQNANIS